ncbi:MAG: murein transglycosylase A [Gammaproteobacteria bacterium]|nr:MAG: murein transglycosylase A [Gammaproteobacteria bacterium]
MRGSCVNPAIMKMLDWCSGRAARPYLALALVVISAVLGSCTALVSKPEGLYPVSWSALDGWAAGRQAAAWSALVQSCEKLATRDAAWGAICADATLMPAPSDAAARAFFETRFTPYVVVGRGGKRQGLITGYYEPLLEGSLVKTERFRYPLYRRPPDLLTVDLGEVYPELRGKRVRGRLQGTTVVPYFSRAEIQNGESPLTGYELAWVDDPVGLFFLHIQGSGRIRLPDGQTLAVGYADQNGHPYVSIGRRLLQMEQLAPEQVNLDTIRSWLAANPQRAAALLNSNPSYVFFTMRDPGLAGPIGSLNVPLTAQRSLAVDPTYIPLGAPVWLDTSLPDEKRPYRRLVFAQDTGGAIKGAARADVFFGQGQQAERLAGSMRQSGRLYVLLPARRDMALTPPRSAN